MEKIETKRLILRKLVKEDAKMIFEGRANDEEVTRYLTWHPHENKKVTEKILAGWLEEYDGDIPEIG